MSATIDCGASYWLAFETSTAQGGIAVGIGDRLLESYRLTKARQHAIEFIPAVSRICASHSIQPSDIRVIFVSCGPGSFTGLRIGITAARMIAMAHGAATVAVPTLSVIAQNAAALASPPAKLAVLLDAKRGHVYAAVFSWENGVYVPDTRPAEEEPLQFLRSQQPDCAVMGEGVSYHRAAVEASDRPVLPPEIYWPRSEIVFQLGFDRARRGLVTPCRDLVPVYVRPPEAEEKRLRPQQGA